MSQPQVGQKPRIPAKVTETPEFMRVAEEAATKVYQSGRRSADTRGIDGLEAAIAEVQRAMERGVRLAYNARIMQTPDVVVVGEPLRRKTGGPDSSEEVA